MPRLSIGSAAAQLAATEALWKAVAAGETPPTLRWYGYRGTALVLGVGQRDEVVDSVAAAAAGVEVVRRSSGGAVVLANEALLALDVAVPEDHPRAGRDVVAAYRWLGEAFAAALRLSAPRAAPAIKLVEVDQARRDQQAQREAAPGSPQAQRGLACFGVLSPYEVMLDGAAREDGEDGRPARKLVGLSQVRKRGVVLFQAGVYMRFRGVDLAARLALPPASRGPLADELDRRIAALSGVGIDSRVVPELMERFSRQVSAPE
jgi:lipoate-protein ligase A